MKLSLVTPSLNQAHYLAECIAHVERLGPDVEHIVSDGGSHDGTLALCQEAQRRRPDDFRFRSEPDDGMYAAVNAGLAMARGEIVGYINCDDVLLPWAADTIRETFTRHPDVGWVIFDALEMRGERWAPVVHPPARLVSTFLRFGGFLAQPAVFLRRETFERYGPFDTTLKLLGDHELWLRLVKARVPVARAWEFLAVQRMVEGQLMVKHAALAEDERRRIMATYGSLDRRLGNAINSAGHRLALLALLRDLVREGEPRLWARARASGYWHVHDIEAAMKSLVSSSLGRRYFGLTDTGRHHLGTDASP